MYKTILVHVDANDAAGADRIQCATHLADDCKATLIGVAAALPAATVELLAVGATALAGGIVTEDPDELPQRFAADKAEFDRWTKGGTVQTDWRAEAGYPAQVLAYNAARADLIVVGPGTANAANSYFDRGELVMRAGRPVLIVPPGVSSLNDAAAVVAWRNTRESRRALADALPLLTTYGQVTLVHVREATDVGDEGMADAAAYLDAHCIAAATKVLEAGRYSASETIVNFAERAQASMIVSGAYGHTRLREWVFGGVTRELLSGGPIARLFSR